MIPFLWAFLAIAATSSYPSTELRQVALPYQPSPFHFGFISPSFPHIHIAQFPPSPSYNTTNSDDSTHNIKDSFMICLILSSFALMPTTQFLVKLLLPSASNRML